MTLAREFLFSAMNQAALTAYKVLQNANKTGIRPSLSSSTVTNLINTARDRLLTQADINARKIMAGIYSGDGSRYWAGDHVMRGAFQMSNGRHDKDKDIGEYGRAVTKSMNAFEGVGLFTPHTSQDFTGFNHIVQDVNDRVAIDAHTYSDDEMRKLHEMIAPPWSTEGLNTAMLMDNFNRFYQVYPDGELPGNLKSYVFITRPAMNIYSGRSSTLVEENCTDPMISIYAQMNPEVLHMLTSDYSSDHDFIPFLQGRTQSLQEVDYQIKTSDFTVPFFSYKYTYPTVTNESRTGGSFDITFREDEQMRVMKLFQFWVYYMDAINKDKLKVDAAHKKRNAYDYMCSVYHIICDPTSEWILFWSKYTGCYPISVPVSNLSFSLGDQIDNKVSITFNYMRAETMDPAVLNDFMANVHTKAENFIDLHDDQFDMVGPSLSSCPVICKGADGKKLVLKWLPYIQNGVGATAINSTDSFSPRPQTTLYSNMINKVATAVKNTVTELSQYKVANASPVIPVQEPVTTSPTTGNAGWALANPNAGFQRLSTTGTGTGLPLGTPISDIIRGNY